MPTRWGSMIVGAGDRIDSGEDVAQVAVAEILAVGRGEGLALAIAAARVGHEDEIAERGEGSRTVADARPVGQDGRGWAPVDVNDERIFLRGVVVGGVEEPSLNIEFCRTALGGIVGEGCTALVQVTDSALPQTGLRSSL